MSNCHKSLKFVIYCAAYGAEKIFSLVFFDSGSTFFQVKSHSEILTKFNDLCYTQPNDTSSALMISRHF